MDKQNKNKKVHPVIMYLLMTIYLRETFAV